MGRVNWSLRDQLLRCVTKPGRGEAPTTAASGSLLHSCFTGAGTPPGLPSHWCRAIVGSTRRVRRVVRLAVQEFAWIELTPTGAKVSVVPWNIVPRRLRARKEVESEAAEAAPTMIQVQTRTTTTRKQVVFSLLAAATLVLVLFLVRDVMVPSYWAACSPS